MERINFFEDEHFSYFHSITLNPAEEQFPMHAHEHHEVYCFLSGAGHYIIEGVEHRLEPRQIYIMRANEAHKARIDCSKPYERIAIHFWSSFVDRLDPERKLLRPFLDRPLGSLNLYDKNRLRSGFVYDCFCRMSEARGDSSEKRTLITCCFYNVLCEIYRAFENETGEELSEGSGSISEIIHYINKNLCEDLSLSLLENRFFISKSHLIRLFKRATGSTVWEYIMVKRLNMARAMLKDGETAASAASACGFSDYSAFYKAYKRKNGVSPTEDRFR